MFEDIEGDFGHEVIAVLVAVEEEGQAFGESLGFVEELGDVFDCGDIAGHDLLFEVIEDFVFGLLVVVGEEVEDAVDFLLDVLLDIAEIRAEVLHGLRAKLFELHDACGFKDAFAFVAVGVEVDDVLGEAGFFGFLFDPFGGL